MSDLVAPFPWFGGKSRAAKIVWAALGDVANYVEPFAGSLAVLLARPHTPNLETVNDLDGYIVNFWRAVKHAPAEVARYANNPVFEADLTARYIWLVQNAPERLARLQGDPDYYDAKVAGWWGWGICCWIGSGWCAGKGPWTSVDGRLVNTSGVVGVNRRLVHLGDAGMGVNRRRVHLGNAGMGVNRRRVHLGNAGMGVECGENAIREWFERLAERLRYVRVCCGDWSRVVTRGALAYGSTVGIFLDPPYDMAMRDGRCYNTDSEGLSDAVRRWAIENGDNPRYRIVLAGYADEHDMPAGWTAKAWTAGRAYGTADSHTDNCDNRFKERLWLSPHCIIQQPRLF